MGQHQGQAAECDPEFVFSILIPVRDRFEELSHCLDGLSLQKEAPKFEVLVIDDGSVNRFQDTKSRPFDLTIIQQAALGIAAARNFGLEQSRGINALFIDSDCRPSSSLLHDLSIELERCQESVAFQLELKSPHESIVWAVEDLRLSAVQEVARCGGSFIRYANTSGFVLRRKYFEGKTEVFELGVRRGEDTLLLAALLKLGKPPRFLPGAEVWHCPDLSTWAYIWKHLSIGFYTTQARRELLSISGGIMTSGQRRSVLAAIIQKSKGIKNRSIVILVFGICYGLERVGRLVGFFLAMKKGRIGVLSTHVDRINSRELIARLTNSAKRGQAFSATYLHAWSLVVAKQNRPFGRELDEFDLVYADGYGVVFALFFSRLKRISKVTANEYYLDLFREAELRRLKVALIGSEEGVARVSAEKLNALFPDLAIIGCLSGFADSETSHAFVLKMKAKGVQLMIVGMGQPRQEVWVNRNKDVLANCSFLCVGALMEIIAGNIPETHRWVRRLGLEWLQRLLLNPSRTWRRYLFGLPFLAFLILRDVVSSRNDRDVV